MTIQTGYTFEISPEQRDENARITRAAIATELQEWTITLTEERAAEIRKQLQADYDEIQREKARAAEEYRRHVEEIEAQRDARDLGTFARGG